jgi:ribosomal protein S18 acetylase RimI-like enzyme
VIRRATSDDAFAIAEVHHRTWQVAYRGIVDDEFLDNMVIEHREQRWRTALESQTQSSITLVAVSDDATVQGHVSVGSTRDDDTTRDDGADAGNAWEIYSIYVDPGQQHRGLGAELLKAALVVVPPETRRITLWVLADNHDARAFYEAQGFGADGGAQDVRIGDQQLQELRYSLWR